MEKDIKVVHEDDIEPTMFRNRETKRLITPEREGSEHVSFHVVTSYNLGLGGVNCYPNNDEILYFLEGGGRIIWGDNCVEVRKGSAVYIPAGCKYQVYGTQVRKTIAVLAPPRRREQWVGREDIVRLEREYKPPR